MNPSPQVDHPLIIFAQLVSAFFLFRLFFRIRRESFPLPQLVAFLGFVILSNAVARFKHYDWFTLIDIAEYITAAIVITVAYYSIGHFQKLEAAKPGVSVRVSDFFDRIETRLTIGLGILILAVFVYYAMSLYNDRNHADAKAIVASNNAKTEATQEFACQQEQYSQERKAILAGVTSISATQQSIASGITSISATQQSLMVGQQKGTRMVANNASMLRRSARATPTPEPIKPKPAADGTIKRKVENLEAEPEKKSFWKKLFGSNPTPAVVDSLQRVSADTLSYHN